MQPDTNCVASAGKTITDEYSIDFEPQTCQRWLQWKWRAKIDAHSGDYAHNRIRVGMENNMLVALLAVPTPPGDGQ